ncbi:MAG TPA: DUF4260 domain-containing protein [Candidatus Limnocylindrales bacterium]
MTAQPTTALSTAARRPTAAEHLPTDAMASRSGVRTLIQAEGLPIFIAGAVAFGALGGAWPAFVPLLLVPDLSMVGYLRDTRLGALTYNLGHNLVTAGVLLVLGLGIGVGWLAIAGSVALAHVGMDRLLGYGLKYPTTFKDTHIQHV